jgi:hypothetical protein
MKVEKMMILLLSSKKKFGVSWPVSLILVLLVSPMFAQVIPTGTISGVVKDSAGLLVSTASVTVVNAASNFQRTAKRSENGAYRFPALPIGQYSVRAEMAGFKTETQRDVILDVAQEAVVNFAMEVGGIKQQVIVTAEQARVDTTTGSLGHIVDSKQIQSYPQWTKFCRPDIAANGNYSVPTQSTGG